MIRSAKLLRPRPSNLDCRSSSIEVNRADKCCACSSVQCVKRDSLAESRRTYIAAHRVAARHERHGCRVGAPSTRSLAYSEPDCPLLQSAQSCCHAAQANHRGLTARAMWKRSTSLRCDGKVLVGTRSAEALEATHQLSVARSWANVKCVVTAFRRITAAAPLRLSFSSRPEPWPDHRIHKHHGAERLVTAALANVMVVHERIQVPNRLALAPKAPPPSKPPKPAPTSA
jgi:hypothetical protein